MAGAAMAAIGLTLLLPDAVRLGPIWVLPLIEFLLLVAMMATNQSNLSRRSSIVRRVAICLVGVLVVGSLVSTGFLIDELISGGSITNEPGPLLATGVSTWREWPRVRASLLGARRERPRRKGAKPERLFGLRLPTANNAEVGPAALASAVSRLPLRQRYELDCLQSHRHDAARGMVQAGNELSVADFICNRGPCHRRGSQCLRLASLRHRRRQIR